MKNDADSLKAQLRQIDDYQRKGLLRAEEADSRRTALRRRLMEVLMPDEPAPRLAWRARLWAAAAMAVLVGGVSAYLLSDRAGLRLRAEQMLDEGRVAAAQRAAAQRETQARRAAGEAVRPDEHGVFPGAAVAPSPPASATGVAPLLAGRVSISPGLSARADADDAVFITVRPAGDTGGLPLAAIRKRVGDLPLDFSIDAAALVGAPERFMQSPAVVVTARVSKSASGLPRPGDFSGSAPPAAPFTPGVAVVIDRVLPGG